MQTITEREREMQGALINFLCNFDETSVRNFTVNVSLFHEKVDFVFPQFLTLVCFGNW